MINCLSDILIKTIRRADKSQRCRLFYARILISGNRTTPALLRKLILSTSPARCGVLLHTAAAAAAAWRCFQGGNFAAYRQDVWNVKPPSAAPLTHFPRNARMEDRATMPRSWRGPREQTFGGNPFTEKATPPHSLCKHSYLPCPALPISEDVLTFQRKSVNLP